jgi:hypothetical protein
MNNLGSVVEYSIKRNPTKAIIEKPEEGKGSCVYDVLKDAPYEAA